MGSERLGLLGICDTIGNINPPYSLAETINRHRFGAGEKPGFGEVTRRWNGDAQEFRIMVMNAGLTHFERVPRVLLEDYGGSGFYMNVRQVLIDIIFQEQAKAAREGVEYWVAQFLIPGASRMTDAEILRQVTEKVDEALNDKVKSPNRKERFGIGYRALGIRRALDERGFHLALLCEIWHKDEFKHLSGTGPVDNPLDNSGFFLLGDDEEIPPWPYAPTLLPLHAWNEKAGLLSLPVLEQARLVHAAFHAYEARGDGAKDVDFYSRKGAQLSRIQTQFGFIDFYQTHLHYGGDMDKVIAAAGDYGGQFKQAIESQGVNLDEAPTPGERALTRRNQLDEFAQFVESTRLPEAIVVVAGDFNIDGLTDEAGADVPPGPDSETYAAREDLLAFANRLGLDDAAIRATQGNQPTLDGSPLRIDYVLVEKPLDRHAFIVDVPVLGVEMLSDAGGGLSDHNAMTFTLRCVPR